MLSERLVEELNKQIKYELYSSHYYLAMAGYCLGEDLPGFANFFIAQAEEEKFHAMKFFNFVDEMDGKIKILGLEEPEDDYKSVLDVFKAALEHEKFVTKRIYHLMDIATEEKEHATISFLRWFVDEQIEEENSMKDIIAQLEKINEDSHAIYMLDKELGQRVFTAPADSEQ
ncbi:ferritin [Anaerosalibacter bizertensis]|uniref:Ferritin n=1 Tax=Anaerosalibacter bizertensis TaxID=932217 RepID=A0A844FEA5_9FIRM|nr:ferritin [Anaerosalibacter bizertensis]MCB5558916.1 ferritin [Anaerosalibacter bizertensis]MCG4564861.1 ferritin [Anaerosalibacter bizertensis]MCG4584395.1 ferritin [Anaerosalibacter bizertensis]MSS42315.1 ferritin [Anaerosalibacter bizertensis]